VLVDRGGRELPIHADIVGRKVEVAKGERVDLLVKELDGKDEVVLTRGENGGGSAGTTPPGGSTA
jgi:pyrimidine operon attenuation protein/uracil phosphoribosyltransferase